MPAKTNPPSTRRRILPPIGSPAYHCLLAAVAIFILGPLGGISATYMNFSLGFFVGGQVLAGILGSVVTYGYGPEGKHGANYMQTMAASVAGLSGMAVLAQAMIWLGLPEPPAWQLILYFLCIGMFGAGLGMLYTPILVDRMQLTYPSGLAVANILRALTDKNLLKRSIAKLGGGMLGGFIGGLAWTNLPLLSRLGVPKERVKTIGELDLNIATLGAGMIVGARIGIPAIVVGAIGYWMTPWFREIGWIGPDDPFRRIGFIFSLGTILGAAIVDLSIIAVQAVQRLRQNQGAKTAPTEDWKKVNTWRLVLWVVAWGIGLAYVASRVLHQPLGFVLFAIGLALIFVLINGISNGISDSNPISSAFVVAVLLMATLGLKNPGVGLMCAAILLISTVVGVDMQQDRSTGWRLGTNRVNQFRYQVIGVVMGAVLAVVLAKLFMTAYPVLKVDGLTYPKTEGLDRWQSAMTYKFVGALKGLSDPKPYVTKALLIGVSIGFVTELLRKLLKANARYREFIRSGRTGSVTDFVLDAVILPSPYASSFGGFVNVQTSIWFATGGVLSSLIDWWGSRRKAGTVAPAEGEVPADMSTTSLVGGGLIGGDSLAALAVGIHGLINKIL